MSNSCRFTPTLLRTLLPLSYVFFAVHETRRIFLSPFIWKLSRRVSSFFLSVQFFVCFDASSTCFVYYHHYYHHRYHYLYRNFIITILCYVPSVINCTVGGAIQMTVYIYIYIFSVSPLLYTCWFWSSSDMTYNQCTFGVEHVSVFTTVTLI